MTQRIRKTHISNRLLAALVGMLAITACSFNPEKTDDYEKLVKTATVEKISSEVTKQFPAIIEEAEEVNLAFRVAGPIEKIFIAEGQFVKKGELVAKMDDRDYLVQKQAVEAQVNQLQSEYKRVKELRERESVAENDYEKMKAGKEMAEAKLKNALDQLQDTKIYAPFSGYITKVMFDQGELVNHGTPIATMIDMSQLKAEINVPASFYINKKHITKIECTHNDMPGDRFTLNLYANNVKANNNGLYKFYLYHSPDKDSKLAPGMNVQVHVTCEKDSLTLYRIPTSALFEKDNQTFVWVVNRGIVVSRKVETDHLVKNGFIGILNGLNEGEQVVMGGLNLLDEGEKVKVVPPASKTNVGNIL